MLFMNEYEIRRAEATFAQTPQHPVLGPAACTLHNLMLWTNQHSDGWAYWPKPCRAAKQLQALIQQGQRWEREEYQYPRTPEPTAEQYRKALVPIKAFRTRQGADFDIVEV